MVGEGKQKAESRKMKGITDSLNISASSFHLSSFPGSRFGLAKTHAIDALCVGAVAGVTGGSLPILRIRAMGIVTSDPETKRFVGRNCFEEFAKGLKCRSGWIASATTSAKIARAPAFAHVAYGVTGVFQDVGIDRK